MSFETLLNGAKKLSDPSFIEGLIIEVAKPFEAEILDMNISQLEEGKLSTGEDTDEYSSKSYQEMKQALGSKSGSKMDYKLTGDFHDGFNAKFKKDSFFIDSSDEKANDLERRYGSDLYGLTDDNEGEVSELLADDLATKIENTLLT